MLGASQEGAKERRRGAVMSEWLGREYNYDIWRPSQAEFQLLKEIHHAGDVAPDFTLPLLDGGELSLSDLKGKPVVMEFGSIT